MKFEGYMVSGQQYSVLVREAEVPAVAEKLLRDSLERCGAVRHDDGLIDSFRAGLALGSTMCDHPEHTESFWRFYQLVRDLDRLPFVEIDGKAVKPGLRCELVEQRKEREDGS